MTAATIALTDFLLARIADDEASATRASGFTPWGRAFRQDNYGNLTIQPARVLATCKAHRTIVELHGRPHECSTYDHTGEVDNCSWCLDGDECSTLRAIAAVWSDHEDYRAKWAL